MLHAIARAAEMAQGVKVDHLPRRRDEMGAISYGVWTGIGVPMFCAVSCALFGVASRMRALRRSNEPAGGRCWFVGRANEPAGAGCWSVERASRAKSL